LAGRPRDGSLRRIRERRVPGATLLDVPRQDVRRTRRRLDAGHAVALLAVVGIRVDLHDAAGAVRDRDVAGQRDRRARRIAGGVGAHDVARLFDDRLRVDLRDGALAAVRDPDVRVRVLAGTHALAARGRSTVGRADVELRTVG